MYKGLIILLGLFLSVPILKADTIYSKEDVLIFDKYVKFISKDKCDTSEGLIIKTAKFFLGTPYVGSTLETDGEEKLVVNFGQLDCTTFVESCMALSATLRSGNVSFDEYCRQLTMLRYRGGKVDGYTSRLHYSSDWINENEERGLWKNISLDLGGEVMKKNVDYMSSHPQAYKHLMNDSSNVDKIKEAEQNINRRNSYKLIPKQKIASIEELIHDGDVILFSTSINGLDYSHLGIAYWTEGKLHFIHASSAHKKVIIEPKTLNDYCKTSKKCTGISLIRLN